MPEHVGPRVEQQHRRSREPPNASRPAKPGQAPGLALEELVLHPEVATVLVERDVGDVVVVE